MFYISIIPKIIRCFIPHVATIAEENKFEIFKSRISNLLLGLGLLNASTYNLTNLDFQCKNMNASFPLIELANSVSSDFTFLRAWIIPSLIEILSNNRHQEYPQKLFTIGTIFKKNNQFDTNIEENERLAVVIASEKTDYTEIRQVLDYLFRSIGITYDVKTTDHGSFINGRVARISVDEKNIAYIGEINPKVLENWELEMPITTFELNLTELFDLMVK